MQQPWRGDGPQGDLPPWVKDVLGDTPSTGVPAPPPSSTPPPYVAPPGRRPRKGPFIALGIATLVLVFLLPIGLVIGGDFGSIFSGGADPSPSPSARVPWAVGNCVRQVSGPTAYPSGTKPHERVMYDMQRQYDTSACDGKEAVGRITTQGAAYSRMDRSNVTEDNCPADTDFVVSVPDQFRLNYQTWCVRTLNAPHAGDPGGGAGKIVVGDCVVVHTSSGNYLILNDRIEEVACADPFYAKVLAITASKAECPADTLSRLPRTVSRSQSQPPQPILCLGQARDGMIARPGECVPWPSNHFAVIARKSCDTDRLSTDRLVTLVDNKSSCPKTTRPHEGTGYDRIICLRYRHDEK